MNAAAVEHGEKSVRCENREVRKLGELASFRTGPFGSALHKSDYIIDGVPVINPMHIVDGRLVPTPEMTVTDSAARSLQDFRLAAGDVVIGRRGDMGRCALVRPQHTGWLCGTGWMIVRPQRGLESAYCQLVLSSPKVVAAIENSSVGSTMINLNQRTLAGLCIDLPPPAEQRAIAATLSDADELIDGLAALIAKKRDLKQAAMQQLLSGRRRLPGFEASWEKRSLGQCLLSPPDYGINAPAVPYSDRLPTYVRITDISDDGNFEPAPRVSVGTTEAGKYALSAGDVVFARTGASVGKSYRYRPEDGPLVFAGFLIRVRPNPDVLLPSFLAAQALSERYWNWVRTESARSGQPGINGRQYSRLPIVVPPVEEQAAIAAIFSEMDGEIAYLAALRNKTLAMKQAMMQQLLTGRIRLR